MGKNSKSRVVVLVLAFLIAAALFVYVSWSKSFQKSSNDVIPKVSIGPAYTSPEWNVTSIGLTEAADVDRGLIFDGNYLFWRVVTSNDFALTAFSLDNYTFRDVWDSNNSITGGPGDLKVIDGSVYASYGYGATSGNPIYNTTIIRSSDLKTWTEYCNSDTTSAESLAQYTGPGPFFDMIVYGGYCSEGYGTYAAIRVWNNTSNSEIDLFDGTVQGSDDVCFLTMLNSTCMIGGDCAPSNIIYTNDGQNWTDEYSPEVQDTFTQQYAFIWGWAVYVNNSTAYVAEENSPYGGGYTGLYNGGLMTWSGVGTTASFDYDMTMESISNGLIGGCGGLWTNSGDYGGAAVVYSYNSDGTLGSLIWRSGYAGSVRNLTYDLNSTAWYGTVLNMDSQEVEIIKIT